MEEQSMQLELSKGELKVKDQLIIEERQKMQEVVNENKKEFEKEKENC